MTTDPTVQKLIGEAKRVCFFSHFHQNGIVAEYVVYYLEQIRDCGFAIVVASTADLSTQEQQKLRGACDHFIARENQGLDFGGWIEAFRHHPQLNAEFLLLANDSVYGGISNLNKFIGDLTREPADFYGVVECDIIKPHLQSWFLLFRPSVYDSRAFKQMFSSPVPAQLSKEEVVQQYEIGLTRTLVAAGLKYKCAFSTKACGILGEILPYNAGQLLWRQLIEDCQIPFLKNDLLRSNPRWVGNIGDWKDVVGRRNASLRGMIEADLAVRGEAKAESFLTRVFHSLKCPFQDEWPELQIFLKRDYQLSDKFQLALNAAMFRIVRFVTRCYRKPIRTVITSWNSGKSLK